jgi:hypothetical protein
MKEDVENAVVEFTNYAAKMYSSVFNQFNNSIRSINRAEEENVFKMQLSKYSFELKKHLEQHVKSLADSHPTAYKQIESVLSEKITYYLQAFWQKCVAL